MASAAPAEQQDDDVLDNDVGAPVEIDYEGEARKMGWESPDEVIARDPKKDRSRLLEAKDFYDRAVVMLPVAQSTIKTMSRKMDQMRRDHEKAMAMFEGAEQRAYDRARADLVAAQEAAVEAGDMAAHRKASKALDELKPPEPARSNDDPDEDFGEIFADWGADNAWYATNRTMATYADNLGTKLAKELGRPPNRAELDELTEKVRSKYEATFPEAFGKAPRQQKRSPVDGGGQRRGDGGGRGYADLPAEAKAMCDRWVKNGTIKSQADYVKSFDWDGFQKAAR